MEILPPNIESRTTYHCVLCGEDVSAEDKSCPLCNRLEVGVEAPALGVSVGDGTSTKDNPEG